jgi:hypothetical protein
MKQGGIGIPDATIPYLTVSLATDDFTFPNSFLNSHRYFVALWDRLTLGRQSLLETVRDWEGARIVSFRTSAEPTRLQKISDTRGIMSTWPSQEHVKQASCPSLTVTLSGFPEEGICNAEYRSYYIIVE